MHGRAIALLVAVVLTLANYIVCPTYQYAGQMQTTKMVRDELGPLAHSVSYDHLDFARFTAFELIILLVVAAGYVCRVHLRNAVDSYFNLSRMDGSAPPLPSDSKSIQF